MNRTKRETYRSGEQQARVTGRIITRVLANWDTHDDTCEPTDHASQSDRVACARGEHR